MLIPRHLREGSCTRQGCPSTDGQRQSPVLRTAQEKEVQREHDPKEEDGGVGEGCYALSQCRWYLFEFP